MILFPLFQIVAPLFNDIRFAKNVNIKSGRRNEATVQPQQKQATECLYRQVIAGSSTYHHLRSSVVCHGFRRLENLEHHLQHLKKQSVLENVPKQHRHSFTLSRSPTP